VVGAAFGAVIYALLGLDPADGPVSGPPSAGAVEGAAGNAALTRIPMSVATRPAWRPAATSRADRDILQSCARGCARDRPIASHSGPPAANEGNGNPPASHRLTQGFRSRARIVRAALSRLSYPPVPEKLRGYGTGVNAGAAPVPRIRAREPPGYVFGVGRPGDVVPIEHGSGPVSTSCGRLLAPGPFAEAMPPSVSRKEHLVSRGP
jgi:hypothetical protein